MPAFTAFTFLTPVPIRRAIPSHAPPPTCLAKGSKKRGRSARSPRSGGGGKRASSRRAKNPQSSEGAARPESSGAEFAAQFEEDVKQRLEPGRGKRRDGREGVKKGPLLMERLAEFDVRKLTPEQSLELLIKGAWVGIGILVGYFFVVHFVIVRDLVPGHGGSVPPVEVAPMSGVE